MVPTRMDSEKTTQKTYTIPEAAKKLGSSRQAVHGALKKGLLEGEKGIFVQIVEIKPVMRGRAGASDRHFIMRRL